MKTVFTVGDTVKVTRLTGSPVEIPKWIIGKAGNIKKTIGGLDYSWPTMYKVSFPKYKKSYHLFGRELKKV